MGDSANDGTSARACAGEASEVLTRTDGDLLRDAQSRRPPSRSRVRAGSDDTELRPGLSIGRYVVLYRLGEGGMGIVYAAFDPELDRKVAIKVMRGHRLGREKMRVRMLREAQALAKLAHPNVVAIHDVGLVDDRLFVAMDFVEGSTLRRWLRTQVRSLSAIIEVFVQAGSGLAAAHAAGVVHRDFKPDNVIVGRDGRVQVLDFGLARVANATRSSEISAGPGTLVAAEPPRHTTAGEGRVGTPGYMAPEQHLGDSSSPATDQFAFCVALHEAVFGRTPFAGSDLHTLTRNVTSGRRRELPRRPRIPASIRRIIERGLAVDAKARYRSMDQLLSELRKYPVRSRTLWLASGTAAVVGLGATAYALASAGAPPLCEGGEHRILAAWTPDRQAEIETAFAASSRPHAAATLVRVDEAIDAWAETWRAAHRDACEATHVRHEQSGARLDLRMSCLGHRLESLRALGEVLSQADDAVVDHAVSAVEALPEVASCAHPRPASQLPHPSPRPAATTAEQRRRLSHAAALEHAGKPREAAQMAAEIVANARELGDESLLAAALFHHGQALESAARPEDARSALREAAVAAERIGEDTLVVDARILLVMVSGDRLGRVTEGRLWAELAAAALARIGGDPSREADLENNLALVLAAEEKPEAVLVHQRRALELAATRPGFSRVRLASFHNNVAGTLAELGQFDEALAHAEKAVQIWHTSMGPEHASTAIGGATVGLVYDFAGDYRRALEHYERAFDQLERALGPGNLRSADLLNNAAIAAVKLGDVERGERALRQVLEIRLSALGEDHADVAGALGNLGSVLGETGRSDEGLALHRRALAIHERIYGPDHLQVVGSLEGIANALERLDHYHEALAPRRRALGIRERVYGPDHPELVLALANLAYNTMLTGDISEAQAQAERAYALSGSPTLKSDVRAFSELVLARVLSAQRRNVVRVAELTHTAEASLGDLPAPAERALIAEIAKVWRWPTPRRTAPADRGSR